MSAGAGVDELGVDFGLGVDELHRTLQHIAHPQVPADGLRVERLALVGEGRIARDHEGPVNTSEAGGQLIGQRVDEVVLRRIAGQIGERQHHDGKTRSLGLLLAKRLPRVGSHSANHHRVPPIRASNAASPIANGSRARAKSGVALCCSGIGAFVAPPPNVRRPHAAGDLSLLIEVSSSPGAAGERWTALAGAKKTASARRSGNPRRAR